MFVVCVGIRSGVAFWMQDFVLSYNGVRRCFSRIVLAIAVKTIVCLSRVASEFFVNQFGQAKQIVSFVGCRVTCSKLEHSDGA